MDLTLFRKHLARVQKIELKEAHQNHAGTENDFSGRDYSKSESSANITGAELAAVKAKLQATSGVYEIFAKKDLNLVHAQAHYDYDESLPFVIQLRLHISKGPKIAKNFNVVYEYRLVKREEGNPKFLKKYNPSKSIGTGSSVNVYIDDLNQLTPFPKSYIASNISSWKEKISR